MTDASPPTLHALRTVRDGAPVGEFAALRLRQAAGDGDPVLTFGPARLARVVAQILGRPVRNRTVGRLTSERAITRTVERAKKSGDTRGVRWHAFADAEEALEPDIALRALPDRAAARAAAGLGDELAIVPLTDRPDAIDARALVFVAGVLGLVGERIALVIPERARRLGEALNYHHNARLNGPVRIVSGAWVAALPTADVFVEPADAEGDDAYEDARALASALGVPIASTAAWRLDADAATHSLPSEIRATVGPVLDAARAARPATVPA